MSGESEKNSTPPDRNCPSTSESPPSWLLGNTLSSKRPSVAAAILCAASNARTFIGWLAGALFAYLKVNSGARAQARLTKGPAIAVEAATDPSRVRRDTIM